MAAGHTVEAPDLPGSGEDNTPATGVTLDACVRRVGATLQKSSEPAFLVGHSMGGVIITQAAAECPTSVAALVYVAAFAPQDGQSLLDLTQLPEGAGDQVQGNVVIAGDPPLATMPTAAARDALYASCPGDVAAWAIARHRPQAVATFATPVSIRRGALDDIPRYYVLCLRDLAIPPALQHRMTQEIPCADIVELDTDHTPHLSMPDQLTEALARFSAHLARQANA